MSNSFAATSLVWVNGQVTIPKYVLDVLGVHSGHHESVTFIIEGDTVRLVNSAVFSMQHLQNSLKTGDPDNEKKLPSLLNHLKERGCCKIRCFSS